MATCKSGCDTQDGPNGTLQTIHIYLGVLKIAVIMHKKSSQRGGLSHKFYCQFLQIFSVLSKPDMCPVLIVIMDSWSL